MAESLEEQKSEQDKIPSGKRSRARQHAMRKCLYVTICCFCKSSSHRMPVLNLLEPENDVPEFALVALKQRFHAVCLHVYAVRRSTHQLPSTHLTREVKVLPR